MRKSPSQLSRQRGQPGRAAPNPRLNRIVKMRAEPDQFAFTVDRGVFAHAFHANFPGSFIINLIAKDATDPADFLTPCFDADFVVVEGWAVIFYGQVRYHKAVALLLNLTVR